MQAEQVADLVSATLPKYDRGTFVNIAANLQSYPALDEFMEDRRVAYSGGHKIEWRALVSVHETARHVPTVFVKDAPSRGDGLTEVEIPWKGSDTHWMFDEFEVSINKSNPERLVNLMEELEVQAIQSLADLMEEAFWVGATASSDIETPFGTDGYWLPPSTSATDSFNIGNATGWSGGPAGINCTNVENWRAYGSLYELVDDDDLLAKIRRAIAFTKFSPPSRIRKLAGNDPGATTDTIIYMPFRVLQPLERLLEAKNENIGFDFGKYANRPSYMGNPMVWVPYLQENFPRNPVIGINWNTYKTVFHEDWIFARRAPISDGDHHTTWVIYIDARYNWRVKNRRSLWRFDLAA